MLGRSSPRELAAVVVLASIAAGAGACRKPPEADPEKVVKLAQTMIRNVPVPGAARDCTPSELQNGATVTMRTLYMLAELEMPDIAGLQAWINPTELDSPAATALVDENASEKAKRQAAAELLAAPYFLIYRVDHIAAPLALGVKEFKRGSVGARALHYNKKGELVCLIVFDWLNDDTKAREAYAKSTYAKVAPEVIQQQREDLVDQMLKKVQSLAIPKQPKK
jgi:hypothetical protein